MSHLPRIPLHLQNPELAKATNEKYAAESYESFRPNMIHPVQYQEMEDRATVSPEYRLRRYPNGELDYNWVVLQIFDAFMNMEYNNIMTPLQRCLLTVLFPEQYKLEEPQMSELRTKLSATEKSKLKDIVEAKIKEADQWAGGMGGSSTPGRSRTIV